MQPAIPLTECWPPGIPFIFQDIGMQILQQPDKVTILYEGQFRQIRMNQPHPADVTPSWYGDSVGRYEGDTLVIDTVGIKAGPYSLIHVLLPMVPSSPNADRVCRGFAAWRLGANHTGSFVAIGARSMNWIKHRFPGPGAQS
jgi:hypothetical protein